MFQVHICYIILNKCFRASNTICRISEKRYTVLLLHLAGKHHQFANNSCRSCSNLCTFLDLGTWSAHIHTYQISKQTDENSNCGATSKIAFCTYLATSGAGLGGHPNFEMPYLGHFLSVLHVQYTVRKVFARAFSSFKNLEKRSTFKIVINETHKTAS